MQYGEALPDFYALVVFIGLEVLGCNFLSFQLESHKTVIYDSQKIQRHFVWCISLGPIEMFASSSDLNGPKMKNGEDSK